MAFPWQDRSGSFAPVRAAALFLCCLPAGWIALEAAMGWLGPRPFTTAIHQSGDWAIRLLVATLAVSPLRRIMHWPKLIGARQILGLAAAAYASGHILLYVADQKLDLARVVSEVVQRFYLGIGSMAWIGLLILTVNSGTKAVSKLGSAEWTRLHKAVHPIVALGLFHFFLQSKLDVSEPILLAGMTFWLWGYRWLQNRDSTESAALVGLAVFATAATALVQIAWYGLATRVRAADLTSGFFDFEYEINEMWYVFSVALAIALARYLIARTNGAPPLRQRPSVRRIQEPGVQA